MSPELTFEALEPGDLDGKVKFNFDSLESTKMHSSQREDEDSVKSIQTSQTSVKPLQQY